MALDKICVAPHQIFDCDLDIQEVGHNGAEEYIRKDALLEWAKVYKEEADVSARGRTDNPSWGEGVAIMALIDKINSL